MLERIPDGAEVVLLPKDVPSYIVSTWKLRKPRSSQARSSMSRSRRWRRRVRDWCNLGLRTQSHLGNGTLMRRRRSRPN